MPENNESNSEPLLSIKTVMPPVQPNVITSDNSADQGSIFDNITSPETSTSSAETNSMQSVFKNEQPNLVWEFTFFDEQKKEVVVYTMTQPLFTHEGTISVADAFAKKQFKENVLNETLIETACFQSINEKLLVVNLRSGAVLKVIQPEAWMKRELEETKKIFDTAVLKAYRDISARKQAKSQNIEGSALQDF